MKRPALTRNTKRNPACSRAAGWWRLAGITAGGIDNREGQPEPHQGCGNQGKIAVAMNPTSSQIVFMARAMSIGSRYTARSTNGGLHSLTILPTDGNNYFRLHHP